jgi:hypothetical protein
MKSLSTFLTEKKISILDKDKVIPLSDLSPKVAQTAINQGQKDGEKSDDAASYKHVKIAVKQLKAAQTEIIPEKAIGMAIGMMLGSTLKIGGDLGSIISADNFIMDGHHRWAATYLCDPSASVEGTQIDLDGVPLVSALNVITKGVHQRSGNAGKGNIADFTGKVIGAVLDDYVTNGIGGQFPISADEVKERLGRVPGAKGSWEEGKKLMMKNADALPKKIMPGAPARIDMPVINPEEVKAAAEMIKKGEVDLTNPFSEETTKAIKERFVAAYVDDVNENKQKYADDITYTINKSTEVEDAKIGNKFYNVKKGEKVRLIDDNGEIATVELASGEIVNIESEFVNEAINQSLSDKSRRVTESKNERIEAGENGITTTVNIHDDGLSLTQIQGTTKDNVFLTDEQLLDLVKLIKKHF